MKKIYGMPRLDHSMDGAYNLGIMGHDKEEA